MVHPPSKTECANDTSGRAHAAASQTLVHVYLLESTCTPARERAAAGWDDITDIRDLLAKEQERGCLDGAMVSPLHGQMDTADQQAIFDRPPPGERKILLSTQIAETSITIEDVTVVVDCGLIKIQTYDALNKVRVLAPTWYYAPPW